MDKLEKVTTSVLEDEAAAIVGAIAAAIGHNEFIVKSIKPFHTSIHHEHNVVTSGGHSHREWHA